MMWRLSSKMQSTTSRTLQGRHKPCKDVLQHKHRQIVKQKGREGEVCSHTLMRKKYIAWRLNPIVLGTTKRRATVSSINVGHIGEVVTRKYQCGTQWGGSNCGIPLWSTLGTLNELAPNVAHIRGPPMWKSWCGPHWDFSWNSQCGPPMWPTERHIGRNSSTVWYTSCCSMCICVTCFSRMVPIQDRLQWGQRQCWFAIHRFCEFQKPMCKHNFRRQCL